MGFLGVCIFEGQRTHHWIIFNFFYIYLFIFMLKFWSKKKNSRSLSFYPFFNCRPAFSPSTPCQARSSVRPTRMKNSRHRPTMKTEMPLPAVCTLPNRCGIRFIIFSFSLKMNSFLLFPDSFSAKPTTPGIPICRGQNRFWVCWHACSCQGHSPQAS